MHLWKRLLEEKPLPSEAAPRSWYGLLSPYQGQAIVTYHRSWIYLTHRFGLKVPVELEPKPGIPPGSRHLAEVVRTVQTEKIAVILQEPYYSLKAADFVARQTGAAVVVCPNTVGGAAEAGSYLQMIDLVVRRLAQALEAAR
jgi:zinc/manganese transport system substrate-binding protein